MVAFSPPFPDDSKHQNEGTHTNYVHTLWWDHSFSYDDSAYQVC